MEKYDSSRFIKNITEFMPLFLQIYEEEDKNIKEIKRKKYLKLIGPDKCFVPEKCLLCSRKMLLFLLSFQLILTKRRLCMRQ
jgi:hypothetical protein